MPTFPSRADGRRSRKKEEKEKTVKESPESARLDRNRNEGEPFLLPLSSHCQSEDYSSDNETATIVFEKAPSININSIWTIVESL